MKIIKLFPILIFLFLCNTKVFATGQIPDLMVIGQDTFSMHTNPLEIYLDSIGNRNFPDFVGSGSTACWRGYQAIWRIDNGKMYLEKIQSCHKSKGNVDANLQKMFGSKFINGRVYAHWFTGLVVLPYGKLKKYVHMGYGSIYSKYMLLEINKGEFRKQLKFKSKQYEKFKAKQFGLFKETPEYAKIVEELKKKGYGDEKFIDSFLKSYVVNYTTRILSK